MQLFVCITHPVNSEMEERIEECVLDFFYEHKQALDLVGVFPYDPILREIAVDIGNQPVSSLEEPLRRWVETQLEYTREDYRLRDHSLADNLSDGERIEQLRHKLLYLLGAVRRLNHVLDSRKIRQVEYLLAGVSTEMADLLPSKPMAKNEPPLEEQWSKQVDDFWEKL